MFSTSLHKFNNQYADAELIIHHTGNGNDLLVCIPLMKSKVSNDSSRFLHKIVDNLIEFNPNPKMYSDKTGYEMYNVDINLNNFNLQKFIPEKQLFYYEGPLPYGNRGGVYNIVVFHTNNVSIIGPKTLNMLRNYIQDPKCSKNVPNYKKNNLYLSDTYNPRSQLRNNIYIEMEPIAPETKGKNGKTQNKSSNELERELIKESIEEIKYGPSLSTKMGKDNVENVEVVTDSMSKQLANSIAKSLLVNPPVESITTKSSTTTEGFSVQQLMFDSPSNEDVIQKLKMVGGISLLASILYVSSKIFYKK